jgi:6-phosphogluconolactonase
MLLNLKKKTATRADSLVPLLDGAAVAEAAAEIFVASANAAVAERGRFTVALSAGTTPLKLYELLGTPAYSNRIPWSDTIVLLTDEPCVPQDHPDSNYRKIREILLDRVPLDAERVRAIEGETSHPARSAHFYECELRELFPDRERPRIDLVLLGVGNDGRTASLLPGTDALEESDRWVVANYVSHEETWRITLSLPTLCHARMALFVISGEEKAPIVVKAFGDLHHGEPYPCERVVPVDGEREILLDQAAASLLPDPY